MKDAYWFDIDAAGLDVSYQKHHDTYCRIFDRCGLKYMVIDAHSGAMGGSQSQEFMVRTPAGPGRIWGGETNNATAHPAQPASQRSPRSTRKASQHGPSLQV